MFQSFVTRGWREVVLCKWAAARQKVGAQAAISEAAPAEAACRLAGSYAKCKSMKPGESLAASASSVKSEKRWCTVVVVKLSLKSKMQCLDSVGFIILAAKFAVLLICAWMRVLMFTSAEAVGRGEWEWPRSSAVSDRVAWPRPISWGMSCFAAVFQTGPTVYADKHRNISTTTSQLVVGVGGSVADISVYCTFRAQYGASQSILAK